MNNNILKKKKKKSKPLSLKIMIPTKFVDTIPEVISILLGKQNMSITIIF
jgi:hypothetical protein